MANQEWDGVTRGATLKGEVTAIRHELADRARAYDWPGVFDLLRQDPGMVNAIRPDGRSWYAPLHQAAHGGAPVEVVDRLVGLGAWRLLRTADRDRPLDIARRRGHRHLFEILEPRPVHDVPAGELARIEELFHEVIRGRAGQFVDEHQLRLPELAVLTEPADSATWCPVPGMYGGFSFRFADTGPGSRLVSESWCRVVGGSGQRHEITAEGARLVAEGFV
ncbi:ankyrin repeat domain-containing protein [Plantactinospora endophytica]|uniref:Ankyrin repeat domain-containing protein n=1 Tax=Plantactinospora endophytica TaxID=673535 RepID=A0ABQ4DSR5_9ACTN|nr:ankyrin repeat domain-containing protein [Plantactinospora endophytica]GIG85494.1 hypothetical protein Pen02_04300 [Plantactinospora endophytica]